MRPRQLAAAAISIGILRALLAPDRAIAAEYSWTGPHNGQWSDAPNWSPAGGPPGATDTAVFATPGSDLYTVVFPGASNDDRVGSLQVAGDNLRIAANRGMRVMGTGADAVHLYTVDGVPAGLNVDGALAVPNGGITLSGASSNPSGNGLSGSFITAQGLTILSGRAGGVTVTGDVQVGNPGAARGSTSVASYTGGTAGGVVRVHPDASLFGGTSATGGVQNAGTIYGGFIDGGLTNTGEYITEYIFSPPGGGGAVRGDFVQTAEGVLREQVSRNVPNAQFGVSGSVDLAGTIVVEPLNPSDVRVGDRFYLIDTDAPIDFSARLVSHYGGFTFEPQLVPGEGLYALTTAVPEPAHAIAVLAALGLLLRRRRAV